jgi:hypothetical protein
MKYMLTLLLVSSFFGAKAQAPPQSLVYHGCGGATVVANQGDLGWSTITYNFQRFQSGNWVTIHTSISNYHIVVNGYIVIASNYRTVLRNNATSEERITNGVTVDPAKFNNAVTKPNPTVTFYWGTPVTFGLNYLEVIPGNFGLNGYRPPFTYTLKKKNSFVFDQKISTTGIFFTNNIEPNQDYVVTVTDYCGQVDSITRAFGFAASARVTARNCSGASIELSSVTTGQNVSFRQPVTFAVAPIADNIDQFNIPDSILSSLSYTYPAGIHTGFTAKRYVVRARDAFGALSNYTVVSTGLGGGMPFIVSLGPSATYCTQFVTLFGNPVESGIRNADSTSNPYIFTPGATIRNIRAGYTYEIVTKDECGRISEPLIQSFVAWEPRLDQFNPFIIEQEGCDYKITVKATTCTPNAEYRLQLANDTPGLWQKSNVFENIRKSGCHTIYARDGNSSEVTRLFCIDSLVVNATANPIMNPCDQQFQILADAFFGTAPYKYAISYDGINFSTPTSNRSFLPVSPGTYLIKAIDACGNESFAAPEESMVGSLYYVNETGFKQTCAANTDTAGGFIRVGIQPSINGEPDLPYIYEVKEITGDIGGELQYGNVVKSGETQDTSFTISGLPGNKHYGIFIAYSCGQKLALRNRVANDFFVPEGILPEPVIAINATTCNEPFFEFSSLPDGGVIEIFKGNSLSGDVVSLATPTTSVPLLGGYYTIRISSNNYEGCTWQGVYHRFVATNDSISVGVLIPELRNICRGMTSSFKLRDIFTGQTPGGTWSAEPEINWVNQDSGIFIPALQAEGEYQFTYEVKSLCNSGLYQTYFININALSCFLGYASYDVESATTPLGCKNYGGDRWYDILDNNGQLWYSINPGADNEIAGACWGARNVYTENPPRSTTIDGRSVYFADRNFYIEPGSINIGTNPVRIRLYYDQFEINRLLNYLKNNGFPSATVNDLRILKKSAGAGSPVDLDIAFNAGSNTSLYNLITPTVNAFGPGGNYYFEFEVNSFSELAVVFANSTTLPVTWLSVTGEMNKGNALIKWSTSSEINTSIFTVEHSEDGLKFVSLHNLPAAGNSNSVRRYEWIHTTPKQGMNYYRIRQTDRDGRYSYSKTVALSYHKNEREIVVFPNPAREKITVLIPEKITVNNNTIKVINVLGQVVLQQKIAPGISQFNVPIQNLPPGNYRMIFMGQSGAQSVSFIKN